MNGLNSKFWFLRKAKQTQDCDPENMRMDNNKFNNLSHDDDFLGP